MPLGAGGESSTWIAAGGTRRAEIKHNDNDITKTRIETHKIRRMRATVNAANVVNEVRKEIDVNKTRE